MAAPRTRWASLGLALMAVLAVSGPAPQAATGSQGVPRVWHSPNVQAVPAAPSAGAAAIHLGDLAYGRYFDRHAMPPPYEFLEPLTEPSVQHVRLEEGRLRFPERGFSVSLPRNALPAGAAPMPPSVRTTPDARWILVVFPYYLPPAREIHHHVGVYAANGSFMGRLDTLPTHALRGASGVLVARDRIVLSTGYCEGLRWSFRFYHLASMTVAEYGCPEGRCGDALFTRLAASGHLLVALEVVEETPERGRVAATRLYILDGQGALVASGAFASIEGGAAMRGGSDAGGCATAEVVAARSPFAVRNLRAVEPLPSGGGWRVRFSGSSGVGEYHLSGKWEGTQREVMP